jgi:hypothetical protein
MLSNESGIIPESCIRKNTVNLKSTEMQLKSRKLDQMPELSMLLTFIDVSQNMICVLPVAMFKYIYLIH